MLPARVKRLIADQERQGEALIALIQIAIVLVVGTLYLASPKGAAPDAPFAPVPWILGIYLIAGMMHLGMVVTKRLPRPLALAGGVIDVALLLLLIWSFHLQYMQPASFSLKAPTLAYLFVIVALRALLFDPVFVVVTGLSAAGGWTALVAYAYFAPAAEVTRDFLTYTSSNAILVGAEVEKVVAILAVTFLLMLVNVQNRRLLVRNATATDTSRQLSRFFAPEIAQRIANAPEVLAAGDAQEREATILHCDIRGFSRMAARLRPQDVIRLLMEYQSRIVPIIRTGGGRVDKFLGDGILASFGALTSLPDHAAVALRVTNSLIAEMDSWNATRRSEGHSPLEVAFTLTCGQVLCGAVGDNERLEYTLIGHPVNLAAHLDKFAKTVPCRALATANVCAAAAAAGYLWPTPTESLDGVQLDGFADPQDLRVLAR